MEKTVDICAILFCAIQAKPTWSSTIEFKRRHSSNHEMESHTQAGFAFQIPRFCLMDMDGQQK